jgi:hypothetical protein
VCEFAFDLCVEFIMFIVFFVFILFPRHKSHESVKIGPYPRGQPLSRMANIDQMQAIANQKVASVHY